jgi:hypothetical protein
MLEERILRDIQWLFVQIRSWAWSKDELELQDCLSVIEEKNNLVNYFSTGFQKEIFNYCFENLKNLIAVNQYELIADFAEAVHNLPEIFYIEYNLTEDWDTYIKRLGDKYNKQYFIQFAENFNGMNTDIPEFNVKKRRLYK